MNAVLIGENEASDMERKVRNRNRIRMYIGVVLLGTAVILSVVSRAFPTLAQWYSVHIYPAWVNTTGRIMGCFPFSVVELLLYIFTFAVLATGVQMIRRMRKNRQHRQELCSWGAGLFLVVAVLIFLYVINCGINYHRVSFSESTGIKASEYSAEDLQSVCRWLTEEVNTYSADVQRDVAGVFVASDVDEQAVDAMRVLGKKYPELAGYYPKPKGLIFPWILSIQNLTGVYSPFTVEANYNSAMVDYYKPFTACHELSHLRGFMQEEEANFIAFLACRESGETQFRYSGNLMGWVYCMNVLYKVDYEAWEEVRSGLAPEVEADLRANREFWAKYDGAVAEVSNRVNDTYLKANGQEKGGQSYNYMVDLIVAYYKL